MVQASALNGINPLSYMGVNPYTPAPLFVQQRAPTSNDFQNFYIGTLWLVTGDSIPEEIWMLVALVAGQATWVQLYPGGGGGGGASQFPCDSGTANEAGGILNILGSAQVSTSGAGNTVTISLNSDIADSFPTDAGTATPLAGALTIHGGTNINTSGAGSTVTINTDANIAIPGSLSVGTTSTFTGAATFSGAATFHSSITDTTLGAGVVQTNAGGLFSSTKGTDGQVLISSTAGVPVWANLTSGDGSITITNGANSIDIVTNGGGGTGSDSFFAYQANSLSGQFIGSADYPLGSGLPLTISFDTSASFFAGDGVGGAATFTAPSTGYYFLQMAGMANSGPFSSSTVRMWVSIIAPSMSLQGGPYWGGTSAATNVTPAPQAQVSGMVHLTAGDVVTFVVTQNSTIPAPGGTVQGSIIAAGRSVTYCSGFRVA